MTNFTQEELDDMVTKALMRKYEEIMTPIREGMARLHRSLGASEKNDMDEVLHE